MAGACDEMVVQIRIEQMNICPNQTSKVRQHVLTPASRWFSVGVTMHFAPLKRLARAAATPVFSDPAIGWDPTNCTQLGFSTCRKLLTSLTICPLTPATSVIYKVAASDLTRLAHSEMRRTVSDTRSTGVPIMTKSDSRMAAEMSIVAWSIALCWRATSSVLIRLPSPVIVPRNPLAFKANPIEPPIRPVPKIVIFRIFRKSSAILLRRCFDLPTGRLCVKTNRPFLGSEVSFLLQRRPEINALE